jgi:hypothetical protein
MLTRFKTLLAATLCFVAGLTALCLLAGLTAGVARAEWPSRVFVPYMYLGSGDNFKLTDCDDACGQKYYTLAFIIADKEGNPAWDGKIPMDKDHYADQIAAIRARGGDVLVSFGGEAGQELALVDSNPESLLAKYQSVIDRYKFTWLDFDIEGKALSKQDVNQHRNSVLAKLQANNPGLIISYTLPVNPDGISQDSRKMLTDAKAKGIKVRSANIMTMYFGKKFTEGGAKLSDLSIASANKAYEQTQAIDPAIQIGLCPDIGNNGEGEIFTLQDAQELKDWAIDKPWIFSLSFWCSNRDSGKPGKNGNTRSGVQQEPWAFSKIFQQITKK